MFFPEKQDFEIGKQYAPEVEKELGLKSKTDIEEYGVDKFNEFCRKIVLKYADEWKGTIEEQTDKNGNITAKEDISVPDCPQLAG